METENIIFGTFIKRKANTKFLLYNHINLLGVDIEIHLCDDFYNKKNEFEDIVYHLHFNLIDSYGRKSKHNSTYKLSCNDKTYCEFKNIVELSNKSENEELYYSILIHEFNRIKHRNEQLFISLKDYANGKSYDFGSVKDYELTKRLYMFDEIYLNNLKKVLKL